MGQGTKCPENIILKNLLKLSGSSQNFIRNHFYGLQLSIKLKRGQLPQRKWLSVGPPQAIFKACVSSKLTYGKCFCLSTTHRFNSGHLQHLVSHITHQNLSVLKRACSTIYDTVVQEHIRTLWTGPDKVLAKSFKKRYQG